jgi:hypothetical protein
MSELAYIKVMGNYHDGNGSIEVTRELTGIDARENLKAYRANEPYASFGLRYVWWDKIRRQAREKFNALCANGTFSDDVRANAVRALTEISEKHELGYVAATDTKPYIKFHYDNDTQAITTLYFDPKKGKFRVGSIGWD